MYALHACCEIGLMHMRSAFKQPYRHSLTEQVQWKVLPHMCVSDFVYSLPACYEESSDAVHVWYLDVTAGIGDEGGLNSPLCEVNMHQRSLKFLQYLNYVLHPDKGCLIHVCSVTCMRGSIPLTGPACPKGYFVPQPALILHCQLSGMHMGASGQRLT